MFNSHLGFFDQVQQVFDVMSQHVLALPHLIQSSEGQRDDLGQDRFRGPKNTSDLFY